MAVQSNYRAVSAVACSFLIAASLCGYNYAFGQDSAKRSGTAETRVPSGSESPNGRIAHRPGQGVPKACDDIRAVGLIEQQLESVKSLDNPGQRIDVMLRSAEALWPYHQERARSIFKDAFDFAAKDLDDQYSTARAQKDFWPKIQDRRWTVVNAVARKDATWASVLARDLAEHDRSLAEGGSSDFKSEFAMDSMRLIDQAEALLPDGEQSALALARASLRYNLSAPFVDFLYRLAGIDQPAADELYREAFAAYASNGLAGLFYLSAYPFGSRGVLPPVTYQAEFTVPSGFVPSAQLQRLYLTTLLSVARTSASVASTHEVYPFGIPECGLLYLALQRLEGQVRMYQPGMMETYSLVEQQLWSAVPAGEQQKVASLRPAADWLNDRQSVFEEAVSRTEGESDSDWRDESLFNDVVGAPGAVPIEKLEQLTSQISDAAVREQVRSWLYFTLARRMLKSADFTKAREQADRVEMLDRRACLYLEIANEKLKSETDKGRAKELLEDTVALALRGPDTMQEVLALTGVTRLYAKLDSIRATEIFGEVISSLNKVQDSDLGPAWIKDPVHARYLSGDLTFRFEPVNLEGAVDSVLAIDFEQGLLMCGTLSDKYLRAVATVAAGTYCLKASAKQPQPAKSTSRTSSDRSR
ncbi:MAG: hypothetical protein ACREDR_01645 [Blastocatellia bacterium]